jgi:hypothetical protein
MNDRVVDKIVSRVAADALTGGATARQGTSGFARKPSEVVDAIGPRVPGTAAMATNSTLTPSTPECG